MRRTTESPMLSQQLLLSVVEELKLPLLQLARQAEYGQLSGQSDLNSMQATAENALQLLDNYVLGVRLNLEPQQLVLEPVSITSVLYDTGQQLHRLAKQYRVTLDLNIPGRFGPIMAHRQGLQAALVSLGTDLIEALPALESPQLTLQLGIHHCRYGIVAGIYTDTERLSSETLKRGRALQGKTRQPLTAVTYGSGAGIFVADAILRAMNLRLKTSRHHRLYGLGMVLQPSRQLQLV